MQDKVIVITGASSGIGAELAQVAAARGAAGVVLAARREPELRAVAERLGERAEVVVSDVSRRADNERLLARSVERFGRVDVWVANAGRGITRPVSQLTDADVDEMFATNFKSVLYALQTAVPHFRARGRGQLIAVSSMLGRIPYVHVRSAYSAAKAAVNSLMASARLEVRPDLPEVHFTTVMPGVVGTPFGAAALHGGPDSRVLPMAQPVGEVAEVIADAIERPRAEVYSRPAYAEMVARYYTAEDVGALEAGPPFVSR
ncbi:MAG: SDR family oxidoreductase [Planctomycetota bacterium]